MKYLLPLFLSCMPCFGKMMLGGILWFLAVGGWQFRVLTECVESFTSLQDCYVFIKHQYTTCLLGKSVTYTDNQICPPHLAALTYISQPPGDPHSHLHNIPSPLGNIVLKVLWMFPMSLRVSGPLWHRCRHCKRTHTHTTPYSGSGRHLASTGDHQR